MFETKNLDKISPWMEDPRAEALDLVVLQEVAGLQNLPCMDSICSCGACALKEFAFDEDTDFFEYKVLGDWAGDSHLVQVILLEDLVADFVCATRSDKRCVEVSFRNKTL